jgi:hypothetical protein
MDLHTIVQDIADTLWRIDAERPVHKTFRPGIGPFGEPQIIRVLAERLHAQGFEARTRRTPDLDIGGHWALEFKIVRPFGDNGLQAENWSVNMLHPYEGNVSLIGDAVKLSRLTGFGHRGLFVIGYEHVTPIVSLDPLLDSFELIVCQVMHLAVSARVEARRAPLCHPVHQVLRCIAWELLG